MSLGLWRAVRDALILGFLLLAATLVAQPQPRRPRGIYAKVNIASETSAQQKTNPSITSAQLDAYFAGLYQGLLANPAVSGLVIQAHWDQVNPNPPTSANPYFWNYLDDGFTQTEAWNSQNAIQTPKTIQLIVTPGFQSPQWLLNEIPSCDGLFLSPAQTPPGNCGKVTFATFGPEEIDGTILPLPWNAVYKSAWQTFLTALAARYESNPVFVSIAVAGPTAASEEMIVPNNGNTPAQSQFGGILTNDMWLQLFALQYPGQASYQKSDQAFIDAWNAAIDMYGQVFSGVTLSATTGSGLPNFGATFTVPPALTAACGNPNMDCAAETTILVHLADPTVGGANAKATQTSGMEASRLSDANLGLISVRLLSQGTSQLASPAAQILGGAQFNTSFSSNTLTEGCISTFPPDSIDTPTGCVIPSTCHVNGCIPVACIPQACLAPGVTPASLTGYKIFNDVPAADLIPPEQAAYNVLNVFFEGTPVASAFGGTPGTAPFNYLQIYAADIQYASATTAPAQVVQAGGAIVSMTAQDLLNLASQELFSIAEPPLLPGTSSAPEFFTGEVSLGSGVYYLQFPNGTPFGYYNYPSTSIIYHYDMGFEAFIAGSGADAYLYDFTSSHWLYTSSSLFPYLYDFSLKTWIYFFPSTTNAGHYTANPRYFSNLTTGKIFTM
jgi:hypothetical protein